MTLQEDVLALVRANPGITDAQLAKKTGKRHQAVNQACRELATAGRIVRQGERGAIQNFPAESRRATAPAAATTGVPPPTMHPEVSRTAATILRPVAGDLAAAERAGLLEIAKGIAELRTYLASHPDPSPTDVRKWFEFVGGIRAIQGNVSNDASLLASILAREYLVTQANATAYDAAAKAQGAAGLDIDERTSDGRRIVGEIKTTVSHHANDLGAEQRKNFFKDFAKLTMAQAHAKYFFLTDRRTFEIVRKRYSGHLPGVTVVLLPDGEAFTVPQA